MKAKQEYFSNQNPFNVTEINPVSLDLTEFSNLRVNSSLAYNNKLVGQVVIKDDVFYLTLDENAPAITISDFPAKNKLIIESANDIKIAEITNKNVDVLLINAKNIDISSSLDSTKSIILEAQHNVNISSSLNNLENTHFSCNEITIGDKAAIKFNPISNLSEKRIRTIDAKKLVLQGAIDSTGGVPCTFNLDSLELQGSYTLKNSQCNVANAIHFNGEQSALTEQVVFEALSCHFSGENTCKNVEFIVDDMEFANNTNSTMNASRFDVLNELVLDTQSSTQWTNCAIYTDSALLKGKADFKQCDIESQICVTSNQTSLELTNIEARLFWQDEGAHITKCDIKATSSSLLNKTNLEKTELLTNSLTYASTGTLNDCKVTVTNSFSGSAIGDLTFKQCLLKSGQTYTQGILNFTDKSYHQTNYIQQSEGTLTINDSAVVSNGLFLSLSNAHCIADNEAKINVQSALLNGYSQWNTSKLEATGPILFCGKATGEKAAIASNDTIYLMNDTQSFAQSAIQSSKQISVLSELVLSENSNLTAHDLNLVNNLNAKNTSINVQSTLNTFNNATFLADATTIKVKDASIMGILKAARSELKTQANLIFEDNAKIVLNQVKLEAGESIVNSSTAEMSGSQVETKSAHLTQAGKVKIDDLKASATTILHSGETTTDKSALFKANLEMMNTGSFSVHELKIQASAFANAAGDITSDKSIIIQAPLIVNQLGNIHSTGSLSMDSLLHLNLGLERAYDYTGKSVYNANYGLTLPSLPNSLSEVFTVSRGLSCAKMALTQLMPSYTNLISLGFMATPYVYSAVKNTPRCLYDAYQSTDSVFTLPSKLYNAKPVKEFREQFKINESADVLPVMMNVMSNGLSVLQLVNVLLGAKNEVFEKTPTPPVQTLPQENKDDTPDPEITVGQVVEFCVDTAVTAFAPSITTQSVWGENAGLMCGANMTDSAYFDTNSGMKAGWNVVGTYRQSANKGLFAGANLVSKGDSYTNHGYTFGGKKASLLFKDSFLNGEGSYLHARNFQIDTDNFTNAGDADLVKGTLNATNLVQTTTGKAAISKTVSTIKKEAELNGEYTFSDESQLNANNITLNDKGTFNQSTVEANETLTQNGQLSAKETVLKGNHVSLNGVEATDGKITSTNELIIKNANTEGTRIEAKNANLADSTFKGKKTEETSSGTKDVKQTDKPIDSITPDDGTKKEDEGKNANAIEIAENLVTHNVIMEGMEIKASNHSDTQGTYQNTRILLSNNFSGTNTSLDTSSVHGKSASLLGETTVNHSAVVAEEKLTQAGHLTGNGASLMGAEVSLDGAHLKESQVIANEQLAIKNSHTVDTEISGKIVDLRDSTFKSSVIPSEEDLEVNNLETDISTDTETQNTEQPNTVTGTETPTLAPKVLGSNQINASESLYTSNVVIEGQVIQAGNVTFSDSLVMKNTSATASASISFAENASIITHNAEFKATHHVMHHAKDHLQTGYLTLEGHEVRDSATGTIRSGEGDENTVYIKADKGGFKSTMHLDNATFDVNNLDSALDLIGQTGQSTNQHFANSLKVKTNQTIIIDGMKPRDCNVAVIADDINLKSDYTSEKDVTLIATDGDVKINANLTGNIVALKSEKNNVELEGKTILGKCYVYIEAENDVILNSTETTVQGKYDLEKEYTKATIMGGVGNEDTGGRGVFIHGKNKVWVTGSDILATGKATVSGDCGVHIKAKAHTYVAEKWSKKKKFCGVRHGKKKYERIETKLNTSTLGSSEDQFEVIASKGEVTGEGGNFIAKKGTDIYAENDINLKGIKTETIIRKQKSSVFGLNSKKSKEKHEYMKLYEFVDDGGNTRLHANTGYVRGQDLRFTGVGDIEYSAPNGKVLLGSSKLNHSRKVRERKLRVTSPTVDTGKKLVSNKKGLLNQLEPTTGHVESAIKSNNPIERAAHGWNAGVSGFNAMNSLQNGTYGQEFLQGFMPKVNVSLEETKTTSEWQTGTGAGVFTKGNVSFNSKDKVGLEGIDLHAKKLKVKTDEYEVKGHHFDSSHKRQSKSVTVGVTPNGGVTDASVSASSNTMKSKRYQNANIRIENEIDVETNTTVIDAANMDCDTIKMKTDLLINQSRQDEMHSTSQSAHASTTGSVGMQQSQTDSKQVNQTAGINVRSGIAKDDMQVKEAILIGGVVTSDGYNGFEPEKLHVTTLKDSSHTGGFGVSGNLNNVVNALKDDTNEKPSRMTTFNVSREKREYKADVKATVYGKEGVSETFANSQPKLNITSSQGKKVIRNTSYAVSIDVPVEATKHAVKSGITFFEKPSKTPETVLQSSPIDLKHNKPVSEPTTNSSPLVDEVTNINDKSKIEKSDVLPESNTDSKYPTNDDVTNGDELSATDMSKPTETSETQEKKHEKPGTFNPSPKPQCIGLKNGRNGQQVFNVSNGQYTSVEKELEISAQNSQLTGDVEVVLFEGEYSGLHYQGKIDPLTNKIITQAKVGGEYNVNLTNHAVDTSVGVASVGVNACGAEAFVSGDFEASTGGGSMGVQGGAGVMGPSVTGEYVSPCMSYMGVTAQVTVDGSAGVGLKATAGVGVNANAQKMKVGAVGKVGLFKGVGGQGSVKVEFGYDSAFGQTLHESYVTIFEGDAMAMSILEKKKNFQPLSEWERDYFDNTLEEVTASAQLTSWGLGK